MFVRTTFQNNSNKNLFWKTTKNTTKSFFLEKCFAKMNEHKKFHWFNTMIFAFTNTLDIYLFRVLRIVSSDLTRPNGESSKEIEYKIMKLGWGKR